jgi:hypothetical protein
MEKFLDQLRNNWVIILFLGTVVMSWTMFSSRLTQAEEDIKDLKTLAQQLNQQATDIAVIKTDVGYIKTRLK